MPTSRVFTETIVISQTDVLYVAQQINLDLLELSKAYPEKLPPEKAQRFFNSYTTFLLHSAVDRLGFSIHDPVPSSLVYFEYRYDVRYGGSVVAGGRGGRPINRAWLPASAIFTAWVDWSQRMLNLSKQDQEKIVAGTDWDIPERNPIFSGRYDGGNWSSGGSYKRGSLEVGLRIYSH